MRPDNIITHPSAPRYRSLAEAMAALRLAEREGVGVDRMVRDMLAVGLPAPAIEEIDGPWVRVSLIGGDPDPEIVSFVGSLEPPAVADDINVVLIIDHLCRHGFVDVDTARPVLQRSTLETEHALRRAALIKVDEAEVITAVDGTPPGAPPAWRLSSAVKARLPRRASALTVSANRQRLILMWANARGRVSSTEVSSLTGLSLVSAGKILADLETDGRLARGRATRAGRGFFYVPVNG